VVADTRRATVTPNAGDGQIDWVIHKYTHYYNENDELIWRTDSVPLLGVRDGTRLNVYAKAFDPSSGNYPWSGWQADWTTFPDDGPDREGTCANWTGATTGYASFVDDALMPYASELCGATSFILCVEQ
jgi:hypothetical protein